MQNARLPNHTAQGVRAMQRGLTITTCSLLQQQVGAQLAVEHIVGARLEFHADEVKISTQRWCKTGASPPFAAKGGGGGSMQCKL